VLTAAGHQVSAAENGRVGLERMRREDCDLVIADIIMPEMEGMETITVIRREFPDLPIIAMSGGGRIGNLDYLESARLLGVAATIPKPFTQEELCRVVDSVLR
jgi:CheY-like chemotaxis protein